MKRILIPTFLTTHKKAGVAYYLINLLNQLQTLDKKNIYYLITYNGNNFMFESLGDNFKIININFSMENRLLLRFFILFFHVFLIPKYIKRLNIDVVFIPSTWFVSNKYITVNTIHDIVEFKTKRYNSIMSFIKRKMVISSIKNSKFIITVSENSKNDLIALGASRANILVTYNGFIDTSHDLFKLENNHVLQSYKLRDKEFFLFVGTVQYHKNLINMLASFSLFLKNCKTDIKLVIAGKPDNAAREVRKFIKNNSLDNRVLFLEYISEETKIILFKKSLCYIFVSLYEGFGFPILEANKYNLPIIISNNSCLPEIAGDSAIQVDPNDPMEISTAMQLIYQDYGLRNKLIEAGKINLNRFSWHNSATQVLDILNY